MEHYAFTATRAGLSVLQKEKHLAEVADVFSEVPVTWHLGDCIGGDADIAQYLDDYRKMFGVTRWVLHAHPSNHRSRANLKVYDHVEKPLDPIVRDHIMVDRSEKLYGYARLDHEELRSGTWATLRYAHRRNKVAVVVWPDGTFRPYRKGI